jgi:hypothetical protein
LRGFSTLKFLIPYILTSTGLATFFASFFYVLFIATPADNWGYVLIMAYPIFIVVTVMAIGRRIYEWADDEAKAAKKLAMVTLAMWRLSCTKVLPVW